MRLARPHGYRGAVSKDPPRQLGLFGDGAADASQRVPERTLAPGFILLHGLALEREPALLDGLETVVAAAPFRHMLTPGGQRMSAAMTSCGPLGWISDRACYRYSALDPESGRPWPAMPEAFKTLARDAAARAGFEGFEPDACLVNRYVPGARMSLHQDRDERDLSAPIVSVSLGLPATFLLGGDTRAERPGRVPLEHGDVLVFGGPARLRFHGILPVVEGMHPALGACRVNLTFRKAV